MDNNIKVTSLIPYYVGFPRSGSHWIRISLEMYTKGKSPISNFLKSKNETVQQLYKRINNGEFRGTHDMDLKFKTDYVLYMFRNPVDCIFSHMVYEGLSLSDSNSVNKFLDIWIKHINKWCFVETFTKKKIIISYESLIKDFDSNFLKIVKFMGLHVDKNKILDVKQKCTKSTINRIVHDKKVINTSNNYSDDRNVFRNKHGKYIMNNIPQNYMALWDDC